MQRITIQLNLKDNEVLDKELEKAIVGAAKAKARETFHDEIEAELKRIVTAEFERLNKRQYRMGNHCTMLEAKVKELMDEKITEAVGKIEVSKASAQQIVDEKLKHIDANIDYIIAQNLGTLDIKSYIKDETASIVKGLYPQEILKLLEQKEMEELKRKIADLESENKSLKEKLAADESDG